jgi:hypothetical protein
MQAKAHGGCDPWKLNSPDLHLLSALQVACPEEMLLPMHDNATQQPAPYECNIQLPDVARC